MKQLFFGLFATLGLFLTSCQQENIAPTPTKTPYRVAQMHFKFQGDTKESVRQVTYYNSIAVTPSGIDFGVKIGDCRCCTEVFGLIQAQNKYFANTGITNWSLTEDNGYFCE